MLGSDALHVLQQAEPDGQRVAEGLALLLGLELVVLADGPQGRLVGAEVAEAGQDPLRGARRRGRGPGRPRPAPVAPGRRSRRPSRGRGRTADRAARRPSARRSPSGRSCSPARRAARERRAGRGTRGRESAGFGRARSLTSASPSESLSSGASRSRLAAHRHISASSCGSGLGRPAFFAAPPPWPAAGTGRAGDRSRRDAAATARRPPAARGSTTRPSTARP